MDTSSTNPVRGGLAGRRTPGAGRMWRRLLLLAVLAALMLLFTDWFSGNYQQRLLQERRDIQANLNRMAWRYVRMDIEDVVYTDDGAYRITLWMENLYPETPVYLMTPSIGAEIQVGSRWESVDTRDATAEPEWREGSVLLLDRRIHLVWDLSIERSDYFQSFPGYMHMTIRGESLVSFEPEPKEYLAERHDSIPFHLRPRDADDDYLRSRNTFPEPVPTFIPTVPRW